MTLTTRQRQFLKGLAHSLSPVVRVGKSGLTDGVIAETNAALESHELIKVRVEIDDAGSRREVAQRLASATGAGLAGTIGKVAILYRAREEDPKIHLPRA